MNFSESDHVLRPLTADLNDATSVSCVIKPSINADVSF